MNIKTFKNEKILYNLFYLKFICESISIGIPPSTTVLLMFLSTYYPYKLINDIHRDILDQIKIQVLFVKEIGLEVMRNECTTIHITINENTLENHLIIIH